MYIAEEFSRIEVQRDGEWMPATDYRGEELRYYGDCRGPDIFPEISRLEEEGEVVRLVRVTTTIEVEFPCPYED